MITTEEQLRALYAAPAERALRKQLGHLDAHCQRFIALSPLCVIASGGDAGRSLLDASPRGGPPGFVQVADAQHLLLPDAGGNNRLDTLTNLLHDPRVALLFLVPGVDETLRVNGTARLRDEPTYTGRFAGERQVAQAGDRGAGARGVSALRQGADALAPVAARGAGGAQRAAHAQPDDP
ncbi:PPOX class probable FMN-dependent enzyme [Paracidovorax wautersii]|uniref:PPOX class probable FMN-dependent enzyme n=1 Tax=Paracidovorax wautersii TaxID=1177982 RepID=A0ABU1IC59_9BURK|nr:PPOX class probable FMN-dependent enzyme [Paracidovorax wautersii]